jgi:hypothetical protein
MMMMTVIMIVTTKALVVLELLIVCLVCGIAFYHSHVRAVIFKAQEFQGSLNPY